MPAYADHRSISRPRERAYALAAVVLVQLLFGWILLSGFHVDVSRPRDIVQQLIAVTLQRPPPPMEPVRPKTPLPESAPKAAPDKLGGSPGPRPSHAPPSVTPVVPVKPSAAPSGGGTGTGPALGAGSGGGRGGTDMVPETAAAISSRLPAISSRATTRGALQRPGLAAR